MTNHTHTLACDMTTVTTTVNGVTTHSAEFACGPTVDALLKAEKAVRDEYVLAGFGADLATRLRAERHLAKARTEFWALVEAASASTVAEFTSRRMRIAA